MFGSLLAPPRCSLYALLLLLLACALLMSFRPRWTSTALMVVRAGHRACHSLMESCHQVGWNTSWQYKCLVAAQHQGGRVLVFAAGALGFLCPTCSSMPNKQSHNSWC